MFRFTHDLGILWLTVCDQLLCLDLPPLPFSLSPYPSSFELGWHLFSLVYQNHLELLRRESGLRVNAKNPVSTAFGIWQGLIGTRLAHAAKYGFNPHTLDDREQTIMFLDYLDVNYQGSPEVALSFWDANGYY